MMDLFLSFCGFLLLLFMFGIGVMIYNRPKNVERREIARMARKRKPFAEEQTGIKSYRKYHADYTPLYNKKGYDFCKSHNR